VARTYTSTVRNERAAANRSAVITAATRMFCADGWTSTTMAGVAATSGLTRQTVYQQFDSKLALLDACIDNALSEGRDIPVREMATYQAMGTGSLDDRVDAAASWLRAAHERSARIQNVLDQAAVSDADAASRLHVREQRRRDEVAFAVGLVAGGLTPAIPIDDAIVDSVWLLASRRQWLMLLDERGWSADQWEQWFVLHTRATLTLRPQS